MGVGRAVGVGVGREGAVGVGVAATDDADVITSPACVTVISAEDPISTLITLIPKRLASTSVPSPITL